MRTRFHWTFMLLVLVIPGGAVADTDGEREALSRLVHELRALEPLIDEAEAQADPEARIRMEYDWLRRDLERVRDGIRAHIEAPRPMRDPEPREVEPLRGDYRR
ncbi:RAQPRD family integrative conjugative element protein [Aquisalimonas lutea]|uniref:integrative conjugative element protein, RAQPRD family n=1 Tax=Aquisalimonas lutea TaxID=1327750 RepID=UPI0025B285A0|nr:RAQPRD family integrative conjugative element protein [Aquisalimonas lutea]MDN3519008.1 RAQPRD family integrative conjugative element protein [Aquisalimonas lutea]